MKQTYSVTLSLIVSMSALLACGAAPEAADDPMSAEQASAEQALTFAGRLPVIIKPLVIAPATPVADLTLDGVMRYYGGGTPTLGLQINVTNVGDSPVTAASGTVSINGYLLVGALYQYWGGTAATPNTVNPGQRGYIKVEVPTFLMMPCNPYSVTIDVAHAMQSGPGVFNNDAGIVTTICPLYWSSPIGAKHLGHPPDPAIAGKTLGDIVSSVVSGRPGGELCSSCHHSSASFPYHPDVPINGTKAIDPYENVSGNLSWAGSWATQFTTLPVTTYPHTEPLKEAFDKWQKDGWLR